jgi:hypothetical protein
MKRLHLWGLVLGVSLLLAALVPAGSVGAQAGGRFRISVYHQGQPIPNMAIIINSSASDPRGYINSATPNLTAGDGGYILDVPAGTYDVHVAEPTTNNLTYPSQVHYEVPVRPGAVIDVVFEMAKPTGMMQGQVALPNGQFVAGTKVSAFGTSARGDGAPYGWGDTFTNEAGWFTIPNLLPNGYYVVFVPDLGIRFDGVPIAAGRVTGDVPLWTSGFYAGSGPRG